MQSEEQTLPSTTSRLRGCDEPQTSPCPEEIKLTDIVAQALPSSPPTTPAPIQRRRQAYWVLRLCSCFYPIRQARPHNPKLQGHYLLPPQSPEDYGKATLVLDLDETLVHSSFQLVPSADFTVTVEIEGKAHHISVMMRPGANEFLRKVAKVYEVVVFTASMGVYADKVIDALDIHRYVQYRLFRESCTPISGVLVKNLDQLGRDLKRVIIVDNSPSSYILQPNNAVGITSWFEDKRDRELADLGEELVAMADEKDVTLLLPEVTARVRELSMKRERERTMRNGAYHPVANSVPPSPATHSRDHGSYNSPRAIQESPTSWSKIAVE